MNSGNAGLIKISQKTLALGDFEKSVYARKSLNVARLRAN
jgi:hypothetical protein